MADKKISQLTAATTPLAGTEVLPIVQGGTTVKVANNDLRPKQIQSNATSGVLQVAGPAAASTRVMTTPDANFTVARTDAAQTFTGQQNFTTATRVTAAADVTREYYSSSTAIFTGYNLARDVIYGNDGGEAIVAYQDWRSAGNHSANSRDMSLVIGLATGSTQTASDKVTIKSNGDINTIGNLVIGTSGKGIDFSATAGTGTSELLADYEEGTWTPVVYGSETAGTYTPSGVIAYYTKIGNQVTVWSNFGFSAASDGTGNVRIQGLPFSYKANTFINGTLFLVSVNTTTTSPLGLTIANTASTASTVLYPALLIDNAGFEQIPISGVTTSSQIGFTVTYTVS